MRTTDQQLLGESERYRNEAMALAAHPDAEFFVEIRDAGESTDTSSSCSRGTLAREPTDDFGEDDESITDVQWTDTVPERLSDDAFVQRTTRLVANRLDTVETR